MEITVKDRIEFREGELIRKYKEIKSYKYSEVIHEFLGFITALNDFRIIADEEHYNYYIEFSKKLIKIGVK